VRYYYSKIINDKKGNKGVDIVMEYIPGGSLRSLLNKFGNFDENITSIYTN